MAGTEQAPADLAADAAFVDHLEETFEEACPRTLRICRRYSIAGRTVNLVFAGAALSSAFTPALAHLAAPDDRAADLTIHVWDGTSTGAIPDAPPWITTSLYGNSEIRRSDVGHVTRIRAAFDGWLGLLSVYDTARGRAFCWLRDSSHVPITMAGTPLRVILQWWADRFDQVLIHAAAVGNSDRAVIIAGASGAGKSSTALTGLAGGLRYLGDDFVLVDAGPTTSVHSLYSSAKVSPSTLATRFPELRTRIHGRARLAEEKELIFVNDHWPDRLVQHLPLHAFLLPRITGEPGSRLVPIAASEVLRVLVPGVLPFPAMRTDAIARLGRLSRSVPGFGLELGTDRASIVGTLERALS